MNLNIPVLGVPCYNRLDLLIRLIASVDHPVENFVLVINNPAWTPADRQSATRAAMANPNLRGFHVIRHPNAGVAGAWNEIVKLFPSPWWMISNDDIQFRAGDLAKMVAAVAGDPQMATWFGHAASWFAVTRRGIEVVGLYDENIFPAYCEDCDWHYRAKLLGERTANVPDTGSVHGAGPLTGSCTVNATPELQRLNSRTHAGNFAYYGRKWGGRPGQEKFQSPFNDPRWPVWAWHFDPEHRAQQQW